MAKAKGSPKTGGRAKGTQNKITSNVKRWICNFIDSNERQFKSDWQELSPSERVKTHIKLLELITPKAESQIKEISDNQFDEIRIGFDENIES